LLKREYKKYLCGASLPVVEQNINSTNYPTGKIFYYVGDVIETIPLINIDKIALLRLDTDYYESTRIEMEYLWPLLTPGGILIVDDYDYWSGARIAVDEYFQKHAISPFLIRLENGRLLIKR
jgi:hypothetical protein